jgi:D-alanine-D-alanine ligase
MKPPKPLRVMMLIEEGCLPPDSVDGLTDQERARFRTEWDVFSTLRSLGHEALRIELRDDLSAIRNNISAFKPDIVFNLIEGFGGNPLYDQHVVSFLELLGQPYTGCNPRGLMLARDKALTKQLLSYHRIRVPAFWVFPRRIKIKVPRRLTFPVVIKPLNVEGSIGISQASVVHEESKLMERVQFIHDSLQTAAIAEQFIEGRELYVGVMGNLRLRTLPVWELVFEKMPEDVPNIATRKVKFDANYQKQWGIRSCRAEGLPPEVEKELPHLCKRIYRHLGLTGLARLDFRMTADGRVHLLEANPNPQIARNEDFADSAEAVGISYESLIAEIIRLGLTYRPEMLM